MREGEEEDPNQAATRSGRGRGGQPNRASSDRRGDLDLWVPGWAFIKAARPRPKSATTQHVLPLEAQA
jgi:hypothetical protein